MESSSVILPVFDLASLTCPSSELSPEDIALCNDLANCLKQTGCIVVRDPRVTSEHNNQFIDMMESYFDQPTEAKLKDSRPELSYQVGATPSGTEVPRVLVDTEMQRRVESLATGHEASMPSGADRKWRFFWRLGERPQESAFTEFNAAPVVPEGFPQWSEVMNGWGGKMMAVAGTVARAAAVGLGLEEDAFTSRMNLGPHLLAPTGSDLSTSQLGTVFAGFHYDLNFLTLHGKSRFPGLFVWLRDGRKVPVRVPDGCLFVQAGKQMEWLTGGAVLAGLHEVVVTEDTLKAVASAQEGGRSCWRVSSTVFSHIASEQTLVPLQHLNAVQEGGMTYPPILAGEQVQQELSVICLSNSRACGDTATDKGTSACFNKSKELLKQDQSLHDQEQRSDTATDKGTSVKVKAVAQALEMKDSDSVRDCFSSNRALLS